MSYLLNSSEILQTIQMINQQHLDVRTITMGINLLDCADRDMAACCRRIYDKICRCAGNLVKTGCDIENEFGIPIVNKRISVTPISLVAAACAGEDYAPIARGRDRAAKETVVNFIGGRVEMANCTFTNYYLFAISPQPIVNLLGPEYDLPLVSGHLDNCILYGMAQDINLFDLEGTDFYLRNSLMKLSGSDDQHFINMVWLGDPKFYVVRDDYIFDYRLKNESDAIARGNRSYCPANARYDRYGIDRWSRDGIDIGAYAWVPAPENVPRK